MRKLLFLVLFIVPSTAWGQAANIFISQTGGGTGASCASPAAASFFNTGGNWGTGGAQIGPGTIVHLCGTITSQLTFQGNGASGNPVILDGTGATMNQEISLGNVQFFTVRNVTWAVNYGLTVHVIDLEGASNGTIGPGNFLDSFTAGGGNFGQPNCDSDIVWLGSSSGTSTQVDITGNTFGYNTVSTNCQSDIIATEGSTNITVEGNLLTQRAPDNCGSCHDDVIQTFCRNAGTTCSPKPSNWTIRYNQLVMNTTQNFNRSWCTIENMDGVLNIYSNNFLGIAGDSTGNGCSISATNASSPTQFFIGNTVVALNGSMTNLVDCNFNAPCTVENNIVYTTTGTSNALKREPTVRDHNLWFGPASPSCTGHTGEICGSDPLFVNTTGLNFSLQAGSPAISAGVNLGAPYNTALAAGATWPSPNLVSRPSVWDMGAFQSGTGGGTVTVAPNPKNYGSVNVGSSSASQTFTITSTLSSSTSLSIANVGGNTADFPQVAGGTCTATLAANSSCTYLAKFSPSILGSESTTLTVTDSAGSQTSALSGTGTSAGTVSLSSNTLGFGTEIKFKLSPNQNTTLSNTSGVTITLTSFSFSGTNSLDFSQVNNCGATLATAGTCKIWVYFTPNATVGTVETATLTVGYTGFAGPALTVELSGISGGGGPVLTYNTRTDLTAQPYNAGLGTIPCPGSNGCSGVIISNLSVSGTAGTVTFLNNLGSCPFGAATAAQVNGNTLLAENKLHTIGTCSGTGFTYNDGVASGSGTNGVASTGGAPLGAGTVIPSDFPNVTLIRVTDANTPTNIGGTHPGHNGFAVTTTGSSETCQWDVSDQRFVIQANGNSNVMFQFNPVTHAFNQLYGNVNVAPNGGHEPTCSHVTPFLFYNTLVQGSDLTLVSYDFTSTTTPPTLANGAAKTIVDFNVACGASLPTGLVPSNDEPGVSVNDEIFSALGATTAGQNNTVIYAIAYNIVTQTCTVWNRGGNGHYYINGVDQGVITIHNTSLGTSYTSDTDLQSIHQLRMSVTGTFLSLTTEAFLGTGQPISNDGALWWPIGTKDAYFASGSATPNTGAGNHTASGLNLVAFMRADCPTFCSAVFVAPMTNPFNSTMLNTVPGDPVPGDRHIGWANDLNDTQPFCGGHSNDTNGTQYQTFLVPFAWNSEITCTNPVNGTMWRQSHTYSSAPVNAIFNSAAAVSTISQDGKFMLFTTDWGCMLGATDGVTPTANCIANGPVNGRTDVFLVVMPISGNVSFTPSSLSYGTVPQNTSSSAQTSIILNTSGSTITYSSLVLSGANPLDFTVGAGTPACASFSGGTLGNGASCQIAVTFTPTAAPGTNESATLTLNFTGGGTSPITIALTGTSGTNAAVTITPTGVLAFPNQVPNTTSASQNITVTSSGVGNLVLAATNAVTMSGPNAANFAITGNTCTNGLSLAPLATCTITVTFTPNVAGVFNAQINLSDNAPGSPQVELLTGTGAAPAPAPMFAIHAWPVAVAQPKITSLVPANSYRTMGGFSQGGPSSTTMLLRIMGTGFSTGTVVSLGGTAVSTKYISPSEVDVTLTQSMVPL